MSYHNFLENFAQATPPTPVVATPTATPQLTVPAISTGTTIPGLNQPTTIQSIVSAMPQAPGDYSAETLASILTGRNDQSSNATQALILLVIFGSVIGIMYMFFNLFKI